MLHAPAQKEKPFADSSSLLYFYASRSLNSAYTVTFDNVEHQNPGPQLSRGIANSSVNFLMWAMNKVALPQITSGTHTADSTHPFMDIVG